jgi:TctA family transporter
MRKFSYEPAPLVLTFVLGPLLPSFRRKRERVTLDESA